MGKKKALFERCDIIIPLFHFILSFVWQGKIFVGLGSWEYFPTMIRNDNVISEVGELHLVFILSRIFCFLIILGLWKLIFYVVNGNVARSDLVILGSILLIGVLFGVILYPTCFGLEIDNYWNFLMARRFQPTYWQSIYTGALYGGCFMVIPHPIALFLVQWTFFWSVVSYIYLGIERLYDKGVYKYITLLFFLFPESYYLAFNAYRNNYYTVMILLYISYLYFAIKNDKKQIGNVQIAIFSIYTAFLMVWRSEGVLLGIGGLLIFLIFILGINKKGIKATCILIITVSISFIVFNKIQSLGAKKYYGQDYMILNTTPVLYSIFNDPNAYLSYEGAEEDLQSIESVIPVEVLKEYGMRGYRNYNWSNGRQDFNQTMATDEQASAYMSAYYHMVIHNLNTYLNVQINSFYTALQLPANRTKYTYQGEPTVTLDEFVYDKWKVGRNEVMETWKTASWADNKVRIGLGVLVNNIINVWRDIVTISGINLILHIVSIITVFFLLLIEILLVIDNQHTLRGSLPFIVTFLVILGEFAAIMLFMPEGRATYLYPMLYACYLMIYIYCFEHCRNDDKRRADER